MTDVAVGGLLPSPTPGAGVFYETWLVPELLKYDQLVHFSTSAVVTTAAWHVCGRWLDPRLCPPPPEPCCPFSPRSASAR